MEDVLGRLLGRVLGAGGGVVLGASIEGVLRGRWWRE